MLIIYCICLFDGCFGPVSGSVGTAGCRFFVGMERDTREGGIGPGVDAGGMF